MGRYASRSPSPRRRAGKEDIMSRVKGMHSDGGRRSPSFSPARGRSRSRSRSWSRSRSRSHSRSRSRSRSQSRSAAHSTSPSSRSRSATPSPTARKRWARGPRSRTPPRDRAVARTSTKQVKSEDATRKRGKHAGAARGGDGAGGAGGAAARSDEESRLEARVAALEERLGLSRAAEAQARAAAAPLEDALRASLHACAQAEALTLQLLSEHAHLAQARTAQKAAESRLQAMLGRLASQAIMSHGATFGRPGDPQELPPPGPMLHDE